MCGNEIMPQTIASLGIQQFIGMNRHSMCDESEKKLPLRNHCDLFQAKAFLTRPKKNCSLRLLRDDRGLTKMVHRHLVEANFGFS